MKTGEDLSQRIPQSKLPVETGETEAVGVGGEEKSPGGSDSARGKMVGQVSDELLS